MTDASFDMEIVNHYADQQIHEEKIPNDYKHDKKEDPDHVLLHLRLLIDAYGINPTIHNVNPSLSR
jgi:hypothetical protein